MKKIIKKIYSGFLIAIVFGFLSLPASLLVAQTVPQNNQTVNNLPISPIIEFVNPVGGTVIKVDEFLSLSAKINRTEAEISSVYFNFSKLNENESIKVPAHILLNTSLILTESVWVAEKMFASGGEGEYNLTADITLKDGSLHKSEAVSVIIEKAAIITEPLIQIVDPADKDILFEGNSLLLSAIVDKNASDITSFDFLINNSEGINIFNTKGIESNNLSGFSEWTGNLNLSGYSGDYALDVRVGYNNQFYNLSTPVHFTVKNSQSIIPELEVVIDYTYNDNDPGQSELKELTAGVNREASTITDFYFVLNKNGILYKKIAVEKPYFSDLNMSSWAWNADMATPLPEGSYSVSASFIYSGDGQLHVGDSVDLIIKKEESMPANQTTEEEPVVEPTIGEESIPSEPIYEERPILNEPVTEKEPIPDTLYNELPLPVINKEEMPEVLPDANNDVPQPDVRTADKGEVVIVNSESIKFTDKDFTVKAKASSNITRLSYAFENLDNERIFTFPAVREKNDGYWSANVDVKNKIIAGKYKVFAKGFLSSGSFVNSDSFFIEILPPNNADNVFIDADNLPLSCTERGYKTPELCNRYLALDPLCRERGLGINDKEKCKRLLFVETLPLVCREIKAADENDCIIKLGISNECFIKGIFSKGACANYKNSTGSSVAIKDEKIKEVAVSKEDDKGNILEEKAVKINDICVYYKIKNIEECNEFLKVKEISMECVANGIKMAEECNDYLIDKYISPECREKGLIRDKECSEYMFQEYSPLVICEGIDEWQCKNKVKEEYLPNIIAAEKLRRNIESNVVQKIDSINEISNLASGLGVSVDNKNIPFKNKEIKIKVLKAKKDAVLTKAGNLIQTLPIAVVIDSDKDGLSDDMEAELGTDPNNPDTDLDGYFDGEEIVNGYSPLINSADDEQGEIEIDSAKKLLEKISPLNMAVIAGNSIEQPKTSGEASLLLSVDEVNNDENNNEGYNISGRGVPGEYVSLYIYSDLPVVVTTRVDENGNWKYDLKKSLSDGEHEVYVVINDNTGRVVSKSSPLNFFIKEAKAVSLEEVVGTFNDDDIEVTEESRLISIYFLFVGGVVFIGILTFVVFLNQRKKENKIG